jgi:predicted AlkP superfamily phosphohydrolase/phosphomutase/tetratricopeptide (TPR) repeat protein
MRRPLRLIFAAALAAALLLPVVFVTRVAPDALAVRRGGFGAGSPVTLSPGWHLRVPLLQTVHRYPAGEIRIQGSEELSSAEGIPLTLPFEFRARIEPARLPEFDEKARGRQAREFLREAIRRSLSAWVAGEPAGEWTTGSGRAAPAAVAGELSALGLTGVSIALGRASAPPEAERAAALARLRGRVRPTGRKILLIGLDGADWQLIDPWVREGKLPALASLKRRGAWANLKAMQPILSPLLWTSVATGRRPEDHGVVDFLVKDPATGEKVPISSRFRKTRALWNIFTDVGRTVDVVAWWASWPAEPVGGVVVSDRVSYSLFGYRADPENLPGATHPPDHLASLRGRLVTDDEITLQEVQQFADITAAEFQERRAAIDRTDPRKAYADPVNHLTRILAATRNYQTATLDLLSRGQPDLLMAYFQGIDEVCHRFAHYMPPKMTMATEEDFRKFRGTVEAFYRHQDRLLGEILERSAPDSTVIVLSDHGFKNGPSRPADDPPDIEGKPGKWHRLYGIFLMTGPGIRPGAIDTVSLLDVAPTVLALAGIPPSEEMPGRILEEAFAPGRAKELATNRVASWEVGPPAGTEQAAAGSAADREMIENLRSLGYIGGTAAEGAGGEPPTDAALSGDTVTYHSNLAALHLKAKRYPEAETELDAALRLMPGYLPALMTRAALYRATGKPAQAMEIYRGILDRGEMEAGIASALAQLYVQTGRKEEGAAYFSGLRTTRGERAEITTALGIVTQAQGDGPGAERLFREALAEDPFSPEAAARLYEILRPRGEAATLEPIVARALERNENSVAHQNLMGLILESRGRMAEAERHLRRAVELDPDYAGVLANLGALCARTGRAAEAIRILGRAVEKEPGNFEARINFGAALGKSGRHRDAILQFEEARRRGFRSPALFNGLAIAYHETGDYAKALENLRRSLELDPDQPEVRAMLADLQARAS